MRVILASTSPRRKEILEKTGIPFDIVPSSYEEDMALPMPPAELAEHLGRGKAAAVAQLNPDAVVIGCDTLLAFENRVTGKPKDVEDAKAMLRALSGKPHLVISGLAVMSKAANKEVVRSVKTTVWFRPLSEKDIEEYIATGEPLGKAGAYAIQGYGSRFIEKIEGDYYNVMGLPLDALVEILEDFGVV